MAVKRHKISWLVNFIMKHLNAWWYTSIVYFIIQILERDVVCVYFIIRILQLRRRFNAWCFLRLFYYLNATKESGSMLDVFCVYFIIRRVSSQVVRWQVKWNDDITFKCWMYYLGFQMVDVWTELCFTKILCRISNGGYCMCIAKG